MHPSWIFGSMLTTGFALFGTAAWIEADRTAFTARPELTGSSLVTNVSSLKSEEVTTPKLPEDATVVLPPVEVTGKRPRALPRPARVQVELATEPCSQWQELGPTRVDDGNAIGVRRVRSLCLGPITTLD
ncbi:MAG: hypothetical protein ACOY0T_06630 [Myxococcota bacterium]